MNFEKQINYWIINAESDIDTAELLLNSNKILHGLFFCHLVLEKILKAYFVKINNNFAPKTHNLFYLIEKLI